LTSLRLLVHGDQHGLVADGDIEVLKRVRLICAHHQGWTSSDAQSPNLEKVQQRRLWTIPADGTGVGLMPQGEVGPFDEEAMHLVNAARDDLPHLRKLLALFRVADASDIGRHRVPHELSRVNMHSDLV